MRLWKTLLAIALFITLLPLQHAGAAGVSGAVKVSGATNHSFAIKGDGTLWAWGNNTMGMLGIGDGAPLVVPEPVQVTSLTNVIDVAAGYTSIALKDDGTVWTWGYNEAGTLGNGTTDPYDTTPTPTPVQVMNADGSGFLTNIKAVAAGFNCMVALSNDGTVWTWGKNDVGQLGNNTKTDSSLPVQVKDPVDPNTALTNIIAIDVQHKTVLALKDDGTVLAWGDNTFGNLGNNGVEHSKLPAQVVEYTPGGQTQPLTQVSAIAAGEYHSVALKQDGTVWTWGLNSQGQLGVGSDFYKLYAAKQVVSPDGSGFLTGVKAIAGGNLDTFAIKQDGTAWAWGENRYGEAGIGTTTVTYLPVQVKDPNDPTGNLQGVIESSGGTYFSLWLKADGTVWAIGSNNYGQIGDGTTDGKLFPQKTHNLLSNNANLFNLQLSAGTLDPVFSWGNLTYSATVNNNVETITVTPTKEEANATISVGLSGQVPQSVESGQASSQIPLVVGPNQIDVVVTAENGSTQRPYTITVTRSATNGNHPPVVVNPISTQTVTVGKDLTVDLSNVITDQDNDSFTFYLLPYDNSKVTANFDQSNLYKLNLHGERPGELTITLGADDHKGGVATTTFTVNVVAPDNNAPVAKNQTITTLVNTPVTGKLTAVDADNDPLSYYLVAKGTKGRAELISQETGTFRYTPYPGETGIDTFTFIANDNKVDSEIGTITVKINQNTPPPVYYPVTEVNLDQTKLTFQSVFGEAVRLKATVLPDNATNKAVKWESSDVDVARVDENGLVTPVSAGKATITVTTVDGGKTATCEVTVSKKTEPGQSLRLEVSEKSLLVKPKKPIKLQVYVVDENGKRKNITNNKLTKYESSDESIVFFKKRLIMAGKKGEATITITYQGARIEVPVKVSTITVTKLTPSAKTVSLKKDATKQLNVTAFFSDKTKDSVTKLATWSSSDPNVVTVSENGMITAVKAGKAQIQAIYGGKSITISVTVK